MRISQVLIFLSGFGFGLQSITSYLCLKEHFPENFSTFTSVTTLFHFVGMAILPSVLNWFKSEYGLKSALILLGGVMWNLVPCGAGTIPPKRTKDRAITEEEEEEMEVQGNELHDRLDDGKTEHFIKNWIPLLLPWYHHVNFRYMHIFSITGIYIYTSWIIFLVSLGTSLGLPTEQAVFLSSVGGIGGFSGKLLGAALFYLDKVNAEVCCLPFLLTSASMMATIFMKHYSMIATFTLISGFSQGLATTLLYGLIPHIVCSHHFPSAVSLVLVSEGVTIQLSGLFSGFLHDALGSTVYVFAFNAVLCAVIFPFMVPWSCNDQTVKKCKGT
ncbi:Monocarboxylate transporter 3 [Holothuria leucospilota]|uniref:Monocarboxylate transporter 3 n=1 Tax=Holothuria leucospilota TaxID=206669 RepID=A0A9Q0YEX9_HOLLE|nr:Monocarboxylate transporter 3 [Holothuria leucospilota]